MLDRLRPLSRAAFWVGWALASSLMFGGCASATHGTDAGPTEDAPGVPRRVLAPVGPSSITLAPVAERTVRFRVEDESGRGLAGTEVAFALEGAPRGSTLRQLGSLSDESGTASVGLVAGPEPSTFRLRATTAGAAPAVVEVSVGTEFGELEVTIDPDIDRNVQSYLVRAVPDVPCADVSGWPTGDERTLGTELSSTTFPALATSVAWTLEARGQTAAGLAVARGCVEGVRVSPTAPASVRLHVRDLPLDFAGAFSVTWSLESAALAESSRAATLEAAVGGAGGALLLDGLRAALTSGSLPDLEALDAARAAALDLRLDAELEAADAALLETLAALADEVDAGFAPLALEAALRPSASTSLSSFSVRLGAESLGIAVEPLGYSVSTTAGRDLLLVTGLELPLGAASLWVSGLEARARARSREGLAGFLRDGASCGTLVTFLSREALLAACDARCARAGCAAAGEILGARLRALAAAEDTGTSLLRADIALAAYDDDDDLRADRLEGDPTASWEPRDGSARTTVASRWVGLRDDALE